MYPSQAAALQMASIREMKEHYGLPDALWQAFVAIAGDPGDDPRLLAVLPSHVVSAALERAVLQDGSPLSAVQASHVGLIYNLAKRVQHTKGEGYWNSWRESSPCGPQTMANQAVAKAAPSPSSSERKMKMTQILDQGDDGEFVVQGEDARAAWYQQYSGYGWWATPGGGGGSNVGAAQCIASEDLHSGHYATKELPGPATLTQWRTCFRLLRTSLIMLDAARLAALHDCTGTRWLWRDCHGLTRRLGT